MSPVQTCAPHAVAAAAPVAAAAAALRSELTAPAPAPHGVELTEDELEHVVGGLARTWMAPAMGAPGFGRGGG